MPKQKTHKGLSKRVKITGTGKVKRRKAFRRHILSDKSGKRRRQLRRTTLIEGKIGRKIKRALGI